MNQYEVVVVGGGPSGLSAALVKRNGSRREGGTVAIWTSMVNVFLRRAWTGSFHRTPCAHVGAVRPVTADTNVCQECVELGDTWPALRLCMTCGHVGCCEKAKNQHALRHYEATGHPIVQAYRERGMHWMWCYVDKALLDPIS